jgi:hypothetical protein
VKFAFISEEKVAFPVAALCQLLAVSPSGFYAAQGRPQSQHAERDHELAKQVEKAHAASKGRYGSPRIHAELKAGGERVGRKRVARLMREKKLAARTRRRFRATTDSKHDCPRELDAARGRLRAATVRLILIDWRSARDAKAAEIEGELIGLDRLGAMPYPRRVLLARAAVRLAVSTWTGLRLPLPGTEEAAAKQAPPSGAGTATPPAAGST